MSLARCTFSSTMNIDIFPTVLALAGIQLPQDRIIDGKIGREEGEK